jgi:uncharacterized protein with HEPN domain
MPKDDLIRIRHMLDSARHAVTFAAGRSRGDLDHDYMLQFALGRAIEVIGEAASRTSPDFRARFEQLPWHQIIGMRHRLIHGYDDIDLDILWETVTIGLPPLIDVLELIIVSEPGKVG